MNDSDQNGSGTPVKDFRGSEDLDLIRIKKAPIRFNSMNFAISNTISKTTP